MTNKINDPNQFYSSHVFFCTNERETSHPRGCCLAKGSLELREYMKYRAKKMGLKSIRINSAGCLDRCERGPSLVIYPEGIWYTCASKEDVDEVLQTHLRDGGRVKRLMMDAPSRN